MFRGNILRKISRLLIMGLMLFMLTSFFACSQDAILNPRNENEENDDKGDGEENPNDDTGKGGEATTGIHRVDIVFLS